ncbi:murein hydrolase activator EnvC family protein [Haloflavibacter putidus]|uniref:Peptidoglycan DD-metalloendopeptidase family protein n=1 Tax=Haloflavibacter putidus TaxID=2576776 RepID=A0A507ZYL2_9FLAO|nr:peptidoglycan DD-metalloendopeptidase family protein [Haloflavibacter putidus]TQD40798.1 peptidoglycan DD-metalloendopeptidase family protein [Haloflavibacter putidus]
MIKKHSFTVLFLFIIALSGINSAQAQSKERQELEARRKELRAQISKITTLLSKNKKQRRSVLTEVEDLNKRINATENLIKINNQEANLLTREINTNIKKIDRLREELKKLKEDYAKMIKRSYRSKSKQSRIMFLFSSESFLQAYKRLQYMKQYTNYRKQQGEEIQKQTQELQQLNKDLVEQKKAKEALLVENRKTREKLRKDKEQQQTLVASIRKKEGEFEQQLNQKQKEVSKIDRQIEKLIKDAIAAENKKTGSTSSSKFALTPEAKALAADFTSNKGKLPWPVKSGVVSMRYGTHPHPVVKHIKIKSNGVRIETNEKEPVRAVFKGSVFKIQAIKGANKAVIVRHGNFMTVYNNLVNIQVEVGDELSTNQIIGKVGKHISTGRPTLLFLIYKNTQALDPSHWIYKM